MKLEIISRLPATPAHPTPLLFVHGAWHGAWCWQAHFLDYFAQAGYAVHALSLRGHGQSEGRARLRWTRIAECVEDVVQVAGQLSAPPVLIGHSMGGLVVQKYLETQPAPAAVLMASVPPAGALGATLRTARRHPREFIHTNLTWSLWPLVGTPALARETFFSAHLPEAELQAYFPQLQDEGYLAFLDMVAFNRPRPYRVPHIPMLVLGAGQDAVFSPAEVEATARAYHTQAVLFPEMGHDMMLDVGWQAVAGHIAGWLKDQRL
jgi:pimeloyl-ACP methyl ester carboxylesterase